MQRALAVALLIVVFAQSSFSSYISRFLLLWRIWLPHVFLIGLYLLVHVEAHFLGASVVILWLSLFWTARTDTTEPKVLWAALLVSALALAVPISRSAAGNVRMLVRPPVHKEWEAAEALQKLGMRHGDSVAVLGHTNIADYWAHLACVRVVADMRQDDVGKFWSADSALRSHIIGLFAKAGARFVVTRSTTTDDHWINLGDMGYSVMDIRMISPSVGDGQPATKAPVLCN
jgi:hypothetical protein